MNVKNALRIGVLLSVSCAIGAFATAEEQPALLALFLVTGFVGWWMTEWRLRAEPTESRSATSAVWRGLPRWITNIILLLIVLAAGLTAWDGSGLVTTFATLLASVLVVKLWQERRQGDYGQLLTMSLFLTVAAVLTDNSALTGILVLIQTPVILVSGMLCQLHAASVRGAGRSSPEVLKHADRMAWQRLRMPLIAMSVACLIVSSAVATAVFVVMPRGYLLPQFPALARPSAGRSIGFASEIDLSAGAPTQDSGITVMSAQILRAGTEVVGSFDTPVYLRGAVLDSYNVGRWSMSPPQPSRYSTLDNYSEPESITSITDYQSIGTATTETHICVLTPSAGQTTAFSAGRAFRWNIPSRIDKYQLDSRFGTLVFTPRVAVSGYAVWCTDAIQVESDSRGVVPEFPEPGVKAYAERLLRAANIEPDADRRPFNEDAIAARVFEAHLRDNFQYSLEADPAPQKDPVTWFLETGRRGHCEFFASALAAMCRSVGVNANVVTGYLGTEFNPGGGEDGRGAYTIRSRDAHAWVEVNTAPGVWSTFDGTPEADPGYRARTRDMTASGFARFMWKIQDLWNIGVVSYDRTSQERLLGLSAERGGLAAKITSLLDHHPRARIAQFAFVVRRYWPWMVSAILIAGAAISVRVVALRRRYSRVELVPGWAMRAARPEAVRLYEELLRILQRNGITRQSGVPLKTTVVTSPSCPPGLRQNLLEAIDLVYDECFAGRGDAHAMVAAREQLRTASR